MVAVWAADFLSTSSGRPALFSISGGIIRLLSSSLSLLFSITGRDRPSAALRRASAASSPTFCADG